MSPEGVGVRLLVRLRLDLRRTSLLRGLHSYHPPFLRQLVNCRLFSALPTPVEGERRVTYRRPRVVSVIESKVDALLKLRAPEDVLRETTLLLKTHAHRLTGHTLESLVSGLIRREVFVEDRTVLLLTKALSAVPMTSEQALACLPLLLCLKKETPAVIELLDSLRVVVEKIREPFPPIKAAWGLYSFKDIAMSPAVERLLGAVSFLVVQSGQAMSVGELSLALFGLRNATDRSLGVERLLTFFTEQLRGEDKVFTGKFFFMSLSGVSNMSAHNAEVRALLQVMVTVLRRSPITLPALDFGKAIRKTRNMTSNYVEVRELMMAILAKLPSEGSDSVPGFSAVINTVVGLQMKGEEFEVRAVLKLLSRWILLSNETINATVLTACLESLRGFDVRVAEIRAVLRSLCLRIDAAINTLPPSCAKDILWSLSTRTADVPEVRMLLRIVHDLLLRHTEDIEERSRIAIECLYGFQRIGGQHAEVHRLLDLIPDRLQLVSPQTSIKSLGLALFGLRNCVLNPKWEPILRCWFHMMLNYLEKGVSNSFLHELELLPLQKLLIVFHSKDCALLNSVKKFKLLMEWIKIKVLLKDNLHECVHPSQDASFFHEICHANLIHQVVREYLDVVETKFNVILYGFEADMVVKHKLRCGQDSLLNIEIDGLCHKIEYKRYFCLLRDEFLEKEYGVKVLRVSVFSAMYKNAQNRNEFRENVLNLLRRAEI